MADSPIHVLRSTFGYPAFRPGQEEVINAVMAGHDAIAVMPTGGGKSLCFQVPALLLRGVTLVVSPLIALMKDQVDQLQRRGVAAQALYSGQERHEQAQIMSAAANGAVTLLYVAPERLATPAFRRFAASLPLRLVAIDEAHCISEWGHEFRPAYLDIPRLFDHVRRVPILAVTATATADVRDDVIASLGLRNPDVVVRGFDRPNLSFITHTTVLKAEVIAAWAQQFPNTTAIVYAGSRRRVESFAYDLQQHAINVASYHAGMPPHVRSNVQEDFLANRAQILVASSAFGMGIDKPDVRHVFHVDLTLTLEAYYQEAGRAGRDGQPSECTLLYQPDDRALMDHFLRYTHPAGSDITSVASYLHGFVRHRQGAPATIDVDAASIAATIGLPQATVDAVLGALEREGMVSRIPPSTALFVELQASRESLEDWAARCPPEWAGVADVIVRSSSSLMASSKPVPFRLEDICRRTDLPAATVIRAFQAMQNAHIVRFKAPQATASLTLLDDLAAIPREFFERKELRRRHAIAKLDAVQRYAEAKHCKRSIILRYFGDPMADEPCGRCSSCKPVQIAALKPSSASALVDRLRSVVRVVMQLDGRYGRTVVADILHGRLTDRTKAIKATQCDDFGVLRDEPNHVSYAILDAAIARGYLQSTGGSYPVIEATPEGEVFLGERPRILPRTEWSRSSTVDDVSHDEDRSPRSSIVNALRPQFTLEQAAYSAGVRPADVVAAIEREIARGGSVRRGRLVPQDLYRMVRSIVITRRHATLRDILHELPHGTDVAAARLALIFVRAELK